MQLTRRRIVAAAIELIEREGVDAASMSRLATELGCGLIALYGHVPSRSALLDAVTEEIMTGVRPAALPQDGWAEQIRAQARCFVQAVRAHPRCAILLVSRPPFAAGMFRPAEPALAALDAAGFSGQDATSIVRTALCLVLGSFLDEAADLPAHADADFEFGLDLLIAAAKALRPAGV